MFNGSNKFLTNLHGASAIFRKRLWYNGPIGSLLLYSQHNCPVNLKNKVAYMALINPSVLFLYARNNLWPTLPGREAFFCFDQTKKENTI